MSSAVMSQPQQQQYPTAPAPYQSASLYVGDLHRDVTEGLLYEIFNKVGPVASIRVCRDIATKNSLGYAYVNFHHPEDADRALNAVNYTTIKDRPCRIMWSQRDPSLRKSGFGNVYVKDLPPSIDHKGLLDLFSVFGNILSCKVATDPETGVSRGFGYVHYETADAANDAITKLNGVTIDGKEVVVQLFLAPGDPRRSRQTTWSNLYVKEYPLDWDEAKLAEVFGAYGTVNSIFIPRDEAGKPKGFAYVDYYNLANQEAAHASAEAAVKALHSQMSFPQEDGSEKLLYVARHVAHSIREREKKIKKDVLKVDNLNRSQGMNVYVKNFPDTLKTEEFLGLFSKFGAITKGDIMRDENGLSKCFGFVCYTTQESASAAIAEMNNHVIGNKKLYVGLYQRGDQRRQQLAAQRQMMGFPINMGRFPGPYGMMPMGGQFQPPRFGHQVIPYQIRGQRVQGPPFNAGRYVVPQYGNQNFNAINSQFYQNKPRNVPQGGQYNNNRRPQNQNRPQNPARANKTPVQFTDNARNVANKPVVGSDLPALDHTLLASVDPQMQKNMIGERLYPLIQGLGHVELAGKITGMLLEMDNAELLHLLESPEALTAKIEEALAVLQQHLQSLGAGNQ